MANRFPKKSSTYPLPIPLSVTELLEFKHADIIHLHWINQGIVIKRAGKYFCFRKSCMDHARHVAFPAFAIMPEIAQTINRHAAYAPILMTPHPMIFP